MMRFFLHLAYAMLVLLLAWVLLGCQSDPPPMPVVATDCDALLSPSGQRRSMVVDAPALADAAAARPWYADRLDRTATVVMPGPLNSPRVLSIDIDRSYNRVSSFNGRVYDSFSQAEYDWAYIRQDNRR